MDYVAVSGGADSTALALLLHERGEAFELVFADTGAELPEVYWLLPRLAQTVGRKLHVVSGGGFFNWLLKYGYLIPGPRIRWCTRVLKHVPQDIFCQQAGAEKVFIGIRADEPRRLHTNTKPRYGIHEFVYPLAEAGLGKKDVFELCRKYDLLNPVYEWRSSVSCFCCFFQRKSDWLGLLKHHPTLYRIAEEWERQSARTTKRFRSWSGRFTLTELREADEAQLRFWPDKAPKCETACIWCEMG